MPELHDRFGLPLTTASAAAVQHYQAGLDRFLSFDAGARERLEEASARDLGFALPYAAQAVVLWQLGQREEAQARARLAQTRIPGVSPRERGHIEAILAVVEGGGHIDRDGHQAPNLQAVQLCRAHLREFPRDALILFLVTILTVFS